MKLKKLVVGLVVSALLAASMTTTVFAAKSPKTENVTPTPTQAPSKGKPSKPGKSSPSKPSKTDNVDALASGITGEIIMYDGVALDPTVPADLYKLTAGTIAKARAQGAANILKAVDAEDSSSKDGKGDKYQETITVKFSSSAFKAGMKITVFHLADGQTQFEKITPDSVADGECVVTFTSLSPVIFATQGTSDKTGETAPIIPIAAAICLAGIVFFGTKVRFAK